MKSILYKLNLRDNFTFIETNNTTFLENLNKIVDKGSINDFLCHYSDKFVNGENEYIGEISPNNFRIRKRYAFLNNCGAYAIGEIGKNTPNSIVIVKISAFNVGNIINIISLFVFYIGALIFMYNELKTQGLMIMLKYGTPMLLLNLSLLIFYLMPKSVKTLREDLEWDLTK